VPDDRPPLPTLPVRRHRGRRSPGRRPGGSAGFDCACQRHQGRTLRRLLSQAARQTESAPPRARGL